ncbi:type II secretion system protein [Helicobacter mesocricetorum]|uniref:type II secretion system protein n=1 Tax=Helicobacter mesocricetorum TaxID=87012 RepID=UPI002D7912C2|nr:prepilin-type N-terminal cleavage/methylation domain-containing protein [Helicobacter mesocricetorum]
MKNKKAFTMLELIFILVILGILAAVAIPKISASRDDAKLVALKSDINTLKSSFPAYFLSQGQGTFNTAITLSGSNWDIGDYKISTRLNNNAIPCISARLLNDENGTQATTPQSVRFLEISTPITANPKGDLCEKLVFELHLNANTPLLIPLLSSSIVF